MISPHPQSRPTLRTAGSLQGVPPSCCGRRVAVWSGSVKDDVKDDASEERVRTDHQGFGEAATTRKQPANLAVEVSEKFLSILPDYAATVRPPPKRCDHLDRDIAATSDLLSHCHRRVYGVRCALVER
jgi:hypothetical protein